MFCFLAVQLCSDSGFGSGMLCLVCLIGWLIVFWSVLLVGECVSVFWVDLVELIYFALEKVTELVQASFLRSNIVLGIGVDWACFANLYFQPSAVSSSLVCWLVGYLFRYWCRGKGCILGIGVVLPCANTMRLSMLNVLEWVSVKGVVSYLWRYLWAHYS